MGINNIILVLLRSHGETFGILELGSPNPNDLDNFSLGKVEQFMPLFSVAVKRNAEEIENRVQAIIKERFTAIHPVLEWRFKEAALNFLEQIENGKQAENGTGHFPGSIPALRRFRYSRLFHRTEQSHSGRPYRAFVNWPKTCCKKAVEYQELPILDELEFFISKNLQKLKHGILSEDEVGIFDSIKTDIDPLFEYLENANPGLKPVYQRILGSQ